MEAPYPPWVMLEHRCVREDHGCSSTIADVKTKASCLTTIGLPISVSLCLASPPEGSRVCVHLPAGLKASYSIVLAADSDSVLVQVASIQDRMMDHFVYSAGAGAADPPRPPSLYLLSPYGLMDMDGEGCVRSYLDSEATGLLRRGDDEFVVAELNMVYGGDDDDTVTAKVAELALLRSTGRGEWSVKRPLIRHYGGGSAAGEELPSSWSNDAVVTYAERLMCWVDLGRGLLFSDVFDESPELRYVPLPDDPYFCRSSYRNVCVTGGGGGGGAIKFVNIFPRCCCGGAGRSYCRRSNHACTVRTWTLKMDADMTMMTWVMDGTIDATELWSLDGYSNGGLPRVQLDYPVVSMDEPHVICFTACEYHHSMHGDKTLWVIMVDMRSKTLRSVFCYPSGRHQRSVTFQQLLASRVSEYFNSKPTSISKLGAPKAETVPNSVARERQMMEMKLQTSNVDVADGLPTAFESNNTSMQPRSLAKILAALEEIPGLDRGDMLKAYRVLLNSFGPPDGFEQ